MPKKPARKAAAPKKAAKPTKKAAAARKPAKKLIARKAASERKLDSLDFYVSTYSSF